MSFLSLQPYESPLTKNGVTSKDWYRFFQGLYQHQAPGAETKLSPASSPFSYQAAVGGQLLISGGTVSMIQWNRSGTIYNTGVTAGFIPVNAGDTVTINYTVTPTVVFIPQ